jgi:hypothetical protein
MALSLSRYTYKHASIQMQWSRSCCWNATVFALQAAHRWRRACRKALFVFASATLHLTD